MCGNLSLALTFGNERARTLESETAFYEDIATQNSEDDTYGSHLSGFDSVQDVLLRRGQGQSENSRREGCKC